MNVFELGAVLTLNSESYKKGINDAKAEGEGFASSFGGSVKKGFGTLLSVGAKALTATTTAIGGFSKGAVEAGATFDSAMSQVGATMGYSMQELSDATSEASQTMAKLRDFAQEMGSSTAFSASEAGEALNYMALAGYDAETSMKMLPTVLDLASAGGIDLASASDMVTDAQSALGLSLDETSAMVDQMAKASSKSNTSVEQLGEAFLTIGANAQSLSGGTVELSTALGILANSGIKGAEGGTHLRNVLLSLQTPTDKASGLLKQLGVDVYDAEGNMLPLNDILMDLNESMDGMTDSEKTDIIGTIFNKADLASATALLHGAGEEWDALADSIADSEGSAKAMAEVQLDNLSGDITLFKSALEGAQIAVSDQLTPSLRKFVQFGSKGLSELTTAFNEGGLSGAMEALGGIISEGLGMIIEMLPEMVSAGAELLTAILQGISDNLPMILDSAIMIINTLVTLLLDNLPMLLEMGLQVLLSLATGIAQALPELIPTIISVILEIVDILIDNVDLLIDSAIALILGLAEGLINAIPILIQKLPTIIISIVEALIRNAPKILQAGVELLKMLWEGIKNSNMWLLNKVKEIVPQIKDKLLEGIQKIKDVGKNFIEGLWNGINDKIQWIKDKISGFGETIMSTVKGIFGIHSPSKAFAEIGKYMAEGLGVGWDKEIGDITDDIQKSVDLDYTANLTPETSSMTPAMTQPVLVSCEIGLEPNSEGLFRIVRNQNRINTKATGVNALALA